MVELYQLTVQCDNEAQRQVKMFEPFRELHAILS